MSLFSRLKIGRKVATITYNSKTCRDEFMVGTIVAIREHDEIVYAVRFDDGEIGLFGSRQLFTKWEKK